jgi:uncharacterized protein (DUF934 family)
MSEPNLEARFEQERNELNIKHAQEIQRLEAQSIQREKEFLNDCKEEYQEQSKLLVGALLKVKFERDRLLLAISWIAVGALVLSVFRGFMNGTLSKALVLVALAGFIGAITAVGHSLKRNRGHLKCIKEGILDPNPVWEENEGGALRFLIFGFISMFLMGLSLFIPAPQKVAVVAPAFLPQTTAAVDTLVVSPPAVPVPVENTSKPSPGPQKSTSTLEPSGNGGNFAGGSARK